MGLFPNDFRTEGIVIFIFKNFEAVYEKKSHIQP